MDFIYKRDNGFWYRRYQTTEKSKSIDRSLRTKNKEVASKKHLELLRQKERESVGQAIPTKVKQALELPLSEHLANYLYEKEQAWTSSKHYEMSSYRLNRLLKECSWCRISDVTVSSFAQWRSHQTVGAKTLNEWLSALRAFDKWLVRNEFLEVRRFKDFEPLKVEGKTFERRVLTVEEFCHFLSCVEDLGRKMVYVTAAYTGFRRAEISQIEWYDVHLDVNSPHIAARASTTKNRKDAEQNIPEFFVEALRAFRPADALDTDKVFNVPSLKIFKSDLKRAGIPYKDARGNRRDFHSLRKLFGTLLQVQGTAPRVAQEMMRHSDRKLTDQIYTDIRLLPKKAAIDTLPDFLGVHKFANTNPAQRGISRDGVSQSGLQEFLNAKPASRASSPHMGCGVPVGQMAEREGFEPSLPLSR